MNEFRKGGNLRRARLKTLTLVAIVTISTSVLAQNDLFEILDTDENGTISKAEASVHSILKEMFDSLDVDKNGELTYKEFEVADLDI
ncbi:calmodulin [Glaciecola sp. 1036]|uniref:calmodulin n=1 Tax=Alteromonadaceae TaxID=72275 RepID=UPI003D03597F